MEEKHVLNEDDMAYIISRIIDQAKEVQNEWQNDKQNEFLQGEKTAYYCVLDTIKSELEIHNADLIKLGIDFDIEKRI